MFLFFALFLAGASGLFGKLLFLYIVGAISDLNGRRIRSRMLQIRFFQSAPNSFANSSNPRPNASKFGGGVGMKKVVLSLWVLFFFFSVFCFVFWALIADFGVFWVFVVSIVCHCVWWVMPVFMSPVPYARLALKAGEFIEHWGGYLSSITRFWLFS